MSLDPDESEMRRIGCRAAELVASHLAQLGDRKVIAPRDADQLRALVAEPLPAAGKGLDDCLDVYFEQLMPHATLVNHPRFFAYVPGPGSFAGALGEWLAAATNTFVGTWLGAAVMGPLELQVIDWLVEAVGLPRAFSGVLTSGGSLANLSALLAALGGVDRAQAVLYLGEEGHHSLAKGARILGIGHVRSVRSDDQLRIDPAALTAAIAADRARGLSPVAVVAAAGTTNTGAVDPISALAAIAEREGLWLHVDAAYGGAAALLPEWRAAFAGWERADSITIDPHKWFYAPFEAGCLLTRRLDRLSEAFAGDASYMQDVPRNEVNFFERGPELSRQNRALKLWMLLRGVGVDAIALHVQRDIDHAALAAELIAQDPRLELITRPSLSLFTFAPRAGDQAALALIDQIVADGTLMLSSTRLAGRVVLRFCVVSHRTTEEDIRAAVARLRKLCDRVIG